MLIFLFDCIILGIAFMTLRNFERGFMAMFCMTIAVPWMVQLKMGNAHITYMDFFCVCLTIPLLIRIFLKRINLNKPFVLIVFFDLFMTFLLMIFSSHLVPLDYQFNSFVKKKIFQEGVFLVAAIVAFKNMSKKDFDYAIFTVSIICGIYGIVAYFLLMNPYVSLLSYTYLGQESLFAFFLDEARGGMLGRAYGTMMHPLAWGQYWGMLLGYFLVTKCTGMKKNMRILFVLVASVNCFISGSRAALLMVLVVLCFAVWAKGIYLNRKKMIWFVCGVLCSLCVLSFIPQNSDFTRYVESTVFFWDKDKEKNNSIVAGSNMDMRQNQLENSFLMIRENLLAGVGYDFQYYSIEHPGKANSSLMGFESVVFKKIVEQGIVGLMVFALILCFLCKKIMNGLEGKRKKILFLGFFVASVMSFIFTGIQGRNWVYFFIFMLALYENKEKVSANFTTGRSSDDS